MSPKNLYRVWGAAHDLRHKIQCDTPGEPGRARPSANGISYSRLGPPPPRERQLMIS